MAQTLLRYHKPVVSPEGVRYEARACGAPAERGSWHGWIEFLPLDGGDAIRSPRETTQPNRVDTEYWATGLTPVYLEGALRRALAPTAVSAPTELQPPAFDGPAPRVRTTEPVVESVLDPFSVYEKGEALLRRQLAALSAWHLVNIIRANALSDQSPDVLNAMPAGALIDRIVEGVRERRQPTTPGR